MFTGQQTSVRFFRTAQQRARQGGGLTSLLFAAPGLLLILFGISILLWPELLAYMVAGLFIAVGFSVTGWGWRLSRRQRNTDRWRIVDGF